MSDITEVDRLNAEIADLKKTVEWLQGRSGIMMGVAAGATLAAVPASEPLAWRVRYLCTSILNNCVVEETKRDARIVLDAIEAQPAPVSGAVVARPDLSKLLDHINEFPEINMGNYGEDEVSTLNNWGMELIDLARAIPAPRAPDSPVAPQLVYPPTMTPLLAHVLSFPNFRTGPIAHVFQKAGFAIPTKCEAEQAFVLDRMIRAALTHGEGWAAAFEDDLRAQFAIIEERKVAATPSEQAEKPK